MNGAKVVLVTGASSGIGQACAELLSARGHTVYGTSRKPPPEPARHRMLELDVTRDDSVQKAVATVLEEQGHLDVVVNNAGYALAGPIEDTSIEEARHQLDTNFFGVLRVCKAVLPSMRARGSGLIVNVSSLGGMVGLPFQGLYSASKFALEGLTESLRQEVAPFGVQVTLLQPGDVRTAITDNRVRARGGWSRFRVLERLRGRAAHHREGGAGRRPCRARGAAGVGVDGAQAAGGALPGGPPLAAAAHVHQGVPALASLRALRHVLLRPVKDAQEA